MIQGKAESREVFFSPAESHGRIETLTCCSHGAKSQVGCGYMGYSLSVDLLLYVLEEITVERYGPPKIVFTVDITPLVELNLAFVRRRK